MMSCARVIESSARRALRWSFLLALPLVAGACASDTYLRSPGHSAMRQRDFDRAASFFETDASKPSTNQILFMMDEGSALFAAGRYKDAIQVFLKAEDLVAIKDYTSISAEVGSLATSSNIKGYKGEDFEKVLINVYLALSYAAVGSVEDAQVEARKINNILHKMINEGKRNYEESPFARYLSGLLWEMNGSYNDAYIDYKKTFEMDKAFPDIGRDLLALSKRLRFNDDYREWSEKFPNESARAMGPGQGEIVVVFEQGVSPIKVPRYGNDANLPKFIRRYSDISSARLKVNGEYVGQTETALDIESLSIRYLEDRIGRMAAAKLAGTLVKGAIAAGVGKASDNADLGWLVFNILQASDRADLRSWRSLPGTLQILRVPVAVGKSHLELDVLNNDGTVAFTKDFGNVEIRPGKKRFLVGR